MADLYDSLAWRIVRERALARDRRRCVASDFDHRPCAAGSLHVHHIVSIADGGEPLALANLATLCARHHKLAETVGFRAVDPADAVFDRARAFAARVSVHYAEQDLRDELRERFNFDEREIDFVLGPVAA